MSRIADLRAIPLRASFADIYGGADRVPPEIRNPAAHFQAIPRLGQQVTLVEVEDDEGRVGTGECFGLPDPRPAALLIAEVARPVLLGLPLDQPPAETLAVLKRYLSALGHATGIAAEAISGLDVALWDLGAVRAGQDLAAHLGAEARPVPTYVSPVPFQPEPEITAAVARRMAAEGAAALKLKVGRAPGTDLAHVSAVRQASPDLPLMLDANCAYDRDAARRVAEGARDLGIAWLEEPLDPLDQDGLAMLAKVGLPIAGGENAFDHRAFEALADGGARVLQPNVTRAGGISGFLAIDALCRARGLSLAPHGVLASTGLAATLHACAAAGSVSLLEANRLPNPLRDEIGPSFGAGPGTLAPPPGPGHGGAPTRDGRRRYELRNTIHDTERAHA